MRSMMRSKVFRQGQSILRLMGATQFVRALRPAPLDDERFVAVSFGGATETATNREYRQL